MTKDVSFEELEATAFEFAKAQSTGTGVDISKRSMELAEKWHAEAGLRKSLYHAKRAEWKELRSESDYDSDDFAIGEIYWVARDDNKPVLAYCNKFMSRSGRMHPIFTDVSDPSSGFFAFHYIELSKGKEILPETPPTSPNKQVDADKPATNLRMTFG